MFARTRHTTMLGAAGATLSLIYTVAVFNLRKTDSNPLVGLFMSVARMLILVVAFFIMYYLLGIKRSPLRGDFLLFIMSGIFMYRAHVEAIGAVASAGGASSAMMKHGPMNTAVIITGSALASLYRTLFACFIILGGYSLFQPLDIYDPVGCLAMVVMAWFLGSAVGLVFFAIRPWAPGFVKVMTQMTQRVQMVASGKMFVANALPNYLLYYFDWNPLFHIIDQTRGYAFINYTPHHSSLHYAVGFTLAVLMLGLMGEFVTRQHESASWSAGR